MFPCPNCKTVNTTSNVFFEEATSKCYRLRKCNICKIQFETIESINKIIKDAIPPAGKKFLFPKPPKTMASLVKKMNIGDYTTANNEDGRAMFRQAMAKQYGSSSSRTRLIKNTKKFNCMRIK